MPELVSVPDVDGVPDVLFAAGAGVGIALAAADDPAALSFFSGGLAPQWGLFQGGGSVIDADCIAAFDHKREWVIADYPVERGAFESYDKVALPFDVRLIYCAGGSEANRAALLASVAAIAGNLQLYDAVTPEKVFPNVNIVHYDFARTAQRGVGLLTVAIWCREVREVVSSTGGSSTPSATGGTGDTAAPSGANPVDGGVVQPRDATPSEMSSVATQDFSGGYNVSGYSVPAYTADVGEAVFTDPATGQEVGRVPGSSALPQTSSSISGLSPAGPDQFSSLNVGSVPGIS
ncbi:hypothetical protein [Methylobacterium sp. SI9]|uniref:hypothetical protein n=1 Tax=Methylobacterium guangdongense TaxID=3138811 RepID=UPI00313DC381